MSFHGTFIWNELMTSDVEAAKAFYAAAFGWAFTVVPGPTMHYTLAHRPGETRPVAGLVAWPKDRLGADSWFAYVGVDDVEATVEATMAAGGTVHERFEVDGVGRFAIIADPVGAVVGVMQPIVPAG